MAGEEKKKKIKGRGERERLGKEGGKKVAVCQIDVIHLPFPARAFNLEQAWNGRSKSIVLGSDPHSRKLLFMLCVVVSLLRTCLEQFCEVCLPHGVQTLKNLQGF